MDRRQFLRSTSVTAAAAAVGWHSQVSGQETVAQLNDRITVAVAGVRGRGGGLLSTFAGLSDVDVKYVCDVDEGVRNTRAAGVRQGERKSPAAIKDFREALDDDAVDALVLGTPDHWHALPAIMACQAGKDVYVEKPDGHNILEGETMVAAAKKYKRVVQLGTQARSSPQLAEAIEYVRRGNVGRVRFAKAWESARQGSIGHPADGQPPKGVDYDFWLGPAPKRRFNSRRFHGSWRWFFDYGTGDLGNDGVHRLDTARRAMAAGWEAEGRSLPDLPVAVSAHGGKHYYDDDQEWPDSLMATFDYGVCVLTYEMRLWSPYRLHEETEGAAVLGDNGYVVFGNRQWRAYDRAGKLVREAGLGDHTRAHAMNFVECLRSRERPNADLETIGHPSSMTCHLGNLAWRVGHTVRFDVEARNFGGDDEANALLSREEYRKPWVLPDINAL